MKLVRHSSVILPSRFRFCERGQFYLDTAVLGSVAAGYLTLDGRCISDMEFLLKKIFYRGESSNATELQRVRRPGVAAGNALQSTVIRIAQLFAMSMLYRRRLIAPCLKST